MLQFAEGSNYGVVLAGAILILIPSILVFIIGQKLISSRNDSRISKRIKIGGEKYEEKVINVSR